MNSGYYDKLKNSFCCFLYGCPCCGPKPGEDRKRYRRAKRRKLKVELKQEQTYCKDCGAETTPGRGAARCGYCWEARFGFPNGEP